jgi:hypothetical protein
MEGERRLGVATAAVGGSVVVLVLVVVTASSGSVHPISESTRTISPQPVPTGGGAASAPVQTPPPPQRWSRDAWPLPDWLGALVEAAVLAGLVVAVLVLLRAVVRKLVEIVSAVRLPQAEPQDAVGVDRVVSPERLAEAVGTGLGAVGTGTPSDAIVACWLALERAAASAGVERRPRSCSAARTPPCWACRSACSRCGAC